MSLQVLEAVPMVSCGLKRLEVHVEEDDRENCT